MIVPEQSEIIFGHYYDILPRGQKQQFIDMLARDTNMSSCSWQRIFVDWSRGIVRGRLKGDEINHTIGQIIYKHKQMVQT